MASISFIISVPLDVIPPHIAQKLLCLLVCVHLSNKSLDPAINKLIEQTLVDHLPYFMFDDRLMSDLFKLEVEAEEIVSYWKVTDLWKALN